MRSPGTIAVSVVRRPRKERRCDDCGKPVTAHIRLYGAAEPGDPPWVMRIGLCCARRGWDDRMDQAIDELAAAPREREGES